MADVEMVFPEKRVSSMPLQLAHLGATLAGALLAGAVVLWKVRAPLACACTAPVRALHTPPT